MEIYLLFSLNQNTRENEPGLPRARVRLQQAKRILPEEWNKNQMKMQDESNDDNSETSILSKRSEEEIRTIRKKLSFWTDFFLRRKDKSSKCQSKCTSFDYGWGGRY